MSNLIPIEQLTRKIFMIRGHKVMIDQDLAHLYGVPTKRLNEQVRRNKRRFPSDFMFQLTDREALLMRSQFATAYKRNIRYNPYVFTEHGVAMLSSVLNSERAIDVNIAIMRAFGLLRELAANHRRLAQRLEKIEQRIGKNEEKIESIFEAIRELMKSDTIGFKP